MNDPRVDLIYKINDIINEPDYDQEHPHLEILPNEEALRHRERFQRKIREKKARKHFLRLRALSKADKYEVKRLGRKLGIGGY